jgi:cvfA/B/C family virulence factor
MARVRVTSWGDIPVLVTARDGADEVTVPLPARFQELVDAAAVHAGLSEADAYLAEWQTGPEAEHPGPAAAAAEAVARSLDARFAEFRARVFGT